MGSKPKTQTTTSTTAPPSYVASELQYGTEQARSLYDQGLPEYYSEQTYAGFTPQQEQAMTLGEQRALDGSPLVDSAQTELQKTLAGDYYNINPYLDQALEAAKRGTVESYGTSVMPSIQSSLSRAGRYGSNAATMDLYNQSQKALAQQLADTEAKTRAQAYETERGRQYSAMGLAPTLAAQDYTDISNLYDIGAKRQAMEQQGINEDISRYQYESTMDQQALDQFLSRITGIAGSAGTVGTQTTPVKGSSTLSQLAGLAAVAAGTYFGGPAGGAAAGGLFNSTVGNTGVGATSSAPMATYGGGAYGGGYSPYNGGTINWFTPQASTYQGSGMTDVRLNSQLGF